MGIYVGSIQVPVIFKCFISSLDRFEKHFMLFAFAVAYEMKRLNSRYSLLILNTRFSPVNIVDPLCTNDNSITKALNILLYRMTASQKESKRTQFNKLYQHFLN